MQTANNQLWRIKLGAGLLLVIFAIQLFGQFPEFWPLTRWGMYSRVGPPPDDYSFYEIVAITSDGSAHRLYGDDLGIRGGDIIYQAFRGRAAVQDDYRTRLSTLVERALNDTNVVSLSAWDLDWQIDKWAVPPFDINNPEKRLLLGGFPLDYYQRSELEDETVDLHFGDNVGLLDFAIVGTVEVRQCDNLYVHTSWQALGTPRTDYQITVVLADENGIGRAQHDGPLANSLTSTWQPDTTHLARNMIAIPCDLETGSYSLLTGVYDLETVQNLPVTYPDGNPYGDLAYLTTVTIIGSDTQ